MFWTLLLGLGGEILKIILAIKAWMTLKEWLVTALAAIVLMLGIKCMTNIFEFLKILLSTKLMRWTLGGLIVVGGLLGTGYYLGRSGTSIGGSRIQYHDLYDKYSKARGQALILDGKVYYPGDYLNKFIQKRGAPGNIFKEVPPN